MPLKCQAAAPRGAQQQRREAGAGSQWAASSGGVAGGTLGVAVVSRWRRWLPGRAEAFTGAGAVSFRGARAAAPGLWRGEGGSRGPVGGVGGEQGWRALAW